MNGLIQAIELWLPDAEASLLEFGAGLYGGAGEMQTVSRTMCFGRAEGLPGLAWDEGRPVLLSDLQTGLFRRAAAARRAGLTSAVALPYFDGPAVRAVLIRPGDALPSEVRDGGGHASVFTFRSASGEERYELLAAIDDADSLCCSVLWLIRLALMDSSRAAAERLSALSPSWLAMSRRLLCMVCMAATTLSVSPIDDDSTAAMNSAG